MIHPRQSIEGGGWKDDVRQTYRNESSPFARATLPDEVEAQVSHCRLGFEMGGLGLARAGPELLDRAGQAARP